MQFSSKVSLGLMLVGYGITYAVPDLETARSTIIAILDREHSPCVAEFNKFCKKYDDVVSNFFSKKKPTSGSAFFRLYFMIAKFELL